MLPMHPADHSRKWQLMAYFPASCRPSARRVPLDCGGPAGTPASTLLRNRLVRPPFPILTSVGPKILPRRRATTPPHTATYPRIPRRLSPCSPSPSLCGSWPSPGLAGAWLTQPTLPAQPRACGLWPMPSLSASVRHPHAIRLESSMICPGPWCPSSPRFHAH